MLLLLTGILQTEVQAYPDPGLIPQISLSCCPYRPISYKCTTDSAGLPGKMKFPGSFVNWNPKTFNTITMTTTTLYEEGEARITAPKGLKFNGRCSSWAFSGGQISQYKHGMYGSNRNQVAIDQDGSYRLLATSIQQPTKGAVWCGDKWYPVPTDAVPFYSLRFSSDLTTYSLQCKDRYSILKKGTEVSSIPLTAGERPTLLQSSGAYCTITYSKGGKRYLASPKKTIEIETEDMKMGSTGGQLVNILPTGEVIEGIASVYGNTELSKCIYVLNGGTVLIQKSEKTTKVANADKNIFEILKFGSDFVFFDDVSGYPSVLFQKSSVLYLLDKEGLRAMTATGAEGIGTLLTVSYSGRYSIFWSGTQKIIDGSRKSIENSVLIDAKTRSYAVLKFNLRDNISYNWTHAENLCMILGDPLSLYSTSMEKVNWSKLK